MRIELFTVCGCSKVIDICDPGPDYRVPIHRGRSMTDPELSPYSDRRFRFDDEYDHPVHGRTLIYREVPS